MHLCIHVFMYLCIYPSMHPCVYVSRHLSIYANMHLCIYAPMYLCIYPSMHPFVYVSMHLCNVSIHLCIYLSIRLSIHASMHQSSYASTIRIYAYICVWVQKVQTWPKNKESYAAATCAAALHPTSSERQFPIPTGARQKSSARRSVGKYGTPLQTPSKKHENSFGSASAASCYIARTLASCTINQLNSRSSSWDSLGSFQWVKIFQRAERLLWVLSHGHGRMHLHVFRFQTLHEHVAICWQAFHTPQPTNGAPFGDRMQQGLAMEIWWDLSENIWEPHFNIASAGISKTSARVTASALVCAVSCTCIAVRQ